MIFVFASLVVNRGFDLVSLDKKGYISYECKCINNAVDTPYTVKVRSTNSRYDVNNKTRHTLNRTAFFLIPSLTHSPQRVFWQMLPATLPTHHGRLSRSPRNGRFC